MRSYFVLTALGHDRVGIVDELTEILSSESCNIEESRMAVLGKEFAGILLGSGEPEATEKLSTRIPALRNELGLQIEIRPTESQKTSTEGRPYSIEAVSLDAPGIMHSVTAILKETGVNIEEVSTETSSAPWTGATMFIMRGTLILPAGVHAVELRERLEGLEHEQDIDIKLEPQNR
jgi:glycine cleavage system transcriptional repressor